ncbi:hypothetical protein [Streptomyces sp. NPDC005093]
MTGAWAVPSPTAKYGGAFASSNNAATKDDSPLAQIAGPTQGDRTVSVIHPSGPMFWVGVVIAGAVGLAAWSTTVRIGPVKASASLGNS